MVFYSLKKLLAGETMIVEVRQTIGANLVWAVLWARNLVFIMKT